MSGFDIVLLLIGAVLVVLSFLFAEKLSMGQNKNTNNQMDLEAISSSIEVLKREIEEYLERAKEATIDSVNDNLCHLSNEKIMSVSEYADMVLDRIDKNHSEVVFLYGMLTDKEKEIKQMLVKPNLKETENTNTMKETHKENKLQAKDSFPKSNQTGKLASSQAAKVEEAMLIKQKEDKSDVFASRQKQILSLYQQGKTVTEIAKQMNIGQGEVQLVVNVSMGGAQ